MHRHEVVGRGLLKLGILKTPDSLKSASADDVVAKLLESSVTSAFFPHGVGHLLGLDTHDVGGLPEGRSSDPLKRYLRLRVPLEEGFVVTVEPGCYFNEVSHCVTLAAYHIALNRSLLIACTVLACATQEQRLHQP